MKKSLKTLLERTIRQYAHLPRRDRDPVGIVWEYDRPEDQEVVALFASSLAYGRVDLLCNATREALTVLGPRPSGYLRTCNLEELLHHWTFFTYRMTRGVDLVDLAAAIQVTLQKEGSLSALYRSGPTVDPVDDPYAQHLTRASHFVRTLRARRRRTRLHRGFRYLLPDPADGSACKRLHLYFRWMVRGPDGIDLGIWAQPSPAELIMPIDTHTNRFCRYLGLLTRANPDLKAALQVSKNLALLDPVDPLRYDFPLCHLGISGDCIHKASADHCPRCPIVDFCSLAQAL